MRTLSTKPSHGSTLTVRALPRTPAEFGAWLGLLIGAGSLIISGFIHLHLWMAGYRNIPIIGTLFIAQGVVALVLAIAVLIRRSTLIFFLASVFLIATVAGLLLSVNFGLFGFKDSLSAPYAMVSLFVELVGALALGALVFFTNRRR